MYGGGTAPVIADNIFNSVGGPYVAIMPAIVDAGDLLFIIADRHSSISGGITGTPSGWTELEQTSNIGVFYKWADGTEDGDSITVPASGSALSIMMTVLRITGADTAIGPQKTATATGSSTAPNPPAIDPPWADFKALLIAVTLLDESSATVSGYPAGYDLFHQVNTGSGAQSVFAAKEVTVATSDDPGAFAISPASDWICFTLAVKGT